MEYCLESAIGESQVYEMVANKDFDRAENVSGDYNPFEHRNVLYPNSNIRSTANLVKACLGSGLLAMPLAMRNSGYALGLIAAVVVGIICTHCVQILVKTSQDVCKIKRVPLLGYAETCEAAFAFGSKKFRFLSRASRIFADCTMLLTYLGSACVYIVMMAESIKQIVDQYYPDFNLSIEIYCLMLFLPLAILCQIKNLKFLAPFSIIAILMLVLVVGICLYYIFDQPITLEGKVPVNDLRQFPLFIATVLFAMEAIGVIMPIENNMARPQNFLGCPGVLYISMTVVVVIYIFLGTLGYLRFGNEVAGSITLNLPMDEWPAILAKILITIAIFFTSALAFYVPVEIMWRYGAPHVNKKHHTKTTIILRICTVAVTVAMAMAIPLLKQVISIVGALFFAMLGVILPPIMQTVFTWDSIGSFVVIKNLILVVVGFFAMVSGCTVSIQEIIEIQYGARDE